MTAAGHARTGPVPSGTTRHPGLPAGVDAWLGRAVPELRGNLRHELIAGGRSNLTYRTTDAAGHVVVLRRPPLGDHPATAHDVLREARILRGLHGQLPAPRVLAVEETGEVAGAPLVVLEHLDGTILRSPADVERHTTEADRALIGPAIVDALVALHGLGPEVIGLGGLAHRRDYITRQLGRWHDNWHRTRIRDLPDLQTAHEHLVAAAPEQSRSGIVHGDFRLDNCMLDSRWRVQGVLDWELTTVGDPLADVGQLLVYWAQADDEARALHDPATVLPGFSTRDELLARYCLATGTDLARIDYFVAYNWWKTACIVEGVHTRVAQGAMSGGDRTAASFAEQSAAVAGRAATLAAALRRH
ncbi:phosphotransferase family protein [Micromonospora sp. DT46]|uniref:phosphotransferase family protein n=1 Tax=Micromonospora sp. DT46 TaxID=3393435 RepID=UPI003CE8C136